MGATKALKSDPQTKEKTDKQLLQAIRDIKAVNNLKGEIICIDDLKEFYPANKLVKNSKKEVFICDAIIGDGKEEPICLVFSSKECLSYLD